MILTFNGKFMSRGLNKVLEYELAPTPDPYNPLGLPPNTVRVRTTNGNPPSKYKDTTYESATLVEGTTDVYDVYKSGTSFYRLLGNAGGYNNNVAEVLGANTTGITNMEGMFLYCTVLRTVSLFDTTSVTSMNSMFSICGSLASVPLFNTANVTNMGSMFNGCFALTTVPLFNTSNVTNMYYMFNSCSSLTSVPLFDTANVENMSGMFNACFALTSVPLLNTSSATTMASMFYNCSAVESGALALYTQASTQATQPSNHYRTFYRCGVDTTSGAAELAQIPSGWK